MEEYKVVVDKDCTKWYDPKTNKLHRIGGPAFESKIFGDEWLHQGLTHREDGPAIDYHNGRVKYYLFNENYKTEESYWAAVEELKKSREPKKELTVGEIEELLGYSVKIVKD